MFDELKLEFSNLGIDIAPKVEVFNMFFEDCEKFAIDKSDKLMFLFRTSILQQMLKSEFDFLIATSEYDELKKNLESQIIFYKTIDLLETLDKGVKQNLEVPDMPGATRS